jgi:hypothetical protein
MNHGPDQNGKVMVPASILTARARVSRRDAVRIRRLDRRFVPYCGPARPWCAICPPAKVKSAVFYDRRRRRALCAACAVEAVDREIARWLAAL